MTECFIGVDIGGTKTAVTLGLFKPDNIKPDIVYRKQFSTKEYDCRQAVKKILDYISKAVEISNENGCGIPKSIGISCGGPLNSQKGIILSPPNLPGWDNVHIIDIIKKETGIDCFLQNDANACALAEWHFGAGRGCRNMIFLTFGTGLGSGLILDGRLYSGTNDMAGELGHIRAERFGPVGYGKAGSYEGFCSGGGLSQIARSYCLEKFQQGQKTSLCDNMDELDNITAKAIAELAYSGDEDAIKIMNITGEYLGRLLSIVVDFINPEKIVIGSIFTRARDLIWPSCNRIMVRECLPLAYECCQVLPAELGDNIGDYAAIGVAYNNYKQSV